MKLQNKFNSRMCAFFSRIKIYPIEYQLWRLQRAKMENRLLENILHKWKLKGKFQFVTLQYVQSNFPIWTAKLNWQTHSESESLYTHRKFGQFIHNLNHLIRYQKSISKMYLIRSILMKEIIYWYLFFVVIIVISVAVHVSKSHSSWDNRSHVKKIINFAQ